MTKQSTLSAKRPIAPAVEVESEMLPASTELPADVHAMVTKVAKANERSFAAQLRSIVKAWAQNTTT